MNEIKGELDGEKVTEEGMIDAVFMMLQNNADDKNRSTKARKSLIKYFKISKKEADRIMEKALKEFHEWEG